ncbi:trichothecene 3-O-acetyltransferase [Pseudozyma hubeiensis SY62]|uniref:Trichothecene 3-O-acetyltransferase n=1 Tax=Pseudozyma hubeiensis (strain SY62) TaxID=1305764 RepID=R9NY87_PSEHS|nr:trichothecene 3-O-acetyltransferase [Pseudozyma hubeiensis SY62]GAC93644.1 trichothecene 3-O-acetyltransferase [Pseudozyma hubeiensis SY62]
MTCNNSLENKQLDILGSVPSLFKLYTQISFIYASGGKDQHQIEYHVTTTLRRGLDDLSKQLPWLSGKVVNEGSSPGKTGTCCIVKTSEIPLVVKHFDKAALTIEKLDDARYPFTMLDEGLVAPCMTLNLPGQQVGLVAETGPVLAVQLNFMPDGLILTIVAQHNVMDMVGQTSIMTWLSNACRGTRLTQEELAIATIDKSRVLTLFDKDWTPDEAWLDRLQIKPAAATQTQAQDGTSPTVTWGYVAFSMESVAALKRIATETKDSDSSYITSDDAVCALIWKCLSRARATRLDANSSTVFARAVDLRARMGVPTSYPGTLTNMTYNHSLLDTVSAEPLGKIAANLRSQLNSPKLARDTRALATVLDRSDDKGSLSITAPVDSSTGIMLSSWASVKLYDLDFGLDLGHPLAVRRPAFIPVESLMYIMPKSPSSGGAIVGMCLREQDWTQLSHDGEWAQYASYIG